MQPQISFMMTVYNDTRLLKRAIESVRQLPFDDWELLILDNSNKSEEPWNIISEYVLTDSRIKAWISTDEDGNRKSVGWCKGTSILIGKAEGKYQTFLASDDILDSIGVQKVYDAIIAEGPDVITVGVAYTQYNDGKLQVLDCCIPEKRIYFNDNRKETIYEILSTTYYNSMFHYCRIDFLKENKIDFYAPYYGDCAGMTAALCRAKKIVSVDDIVYYLTYNTSQTSGNYIMNGCINFSKQWEEICRIYDEGMYADIPKEKDYKKYIAHRIYSNLYGNIEIIRDSDNFRDSEMNSIVVTYEERVKEIERVLNDKYIQDLINYIDGE